MSTMTASVPAYRLIPGEQYVAPEFGPRPVTLHGASHVRDGYVYLVWELRTNLVNGLPVHVTRRVRWDHTFAATASHV